MKAWSLLLTHNTTGSRGHNKVGLLNSDHPLRESVANNWSSLNFDAQNWEHESPALGCIDRTLICCVYRLFGFSC